MKTPSSILLASLLFLLGCLSTRAASSLGVPVAIDVRKTNGQTQADLKWLADGDRQYDVNEFCFIE